MTLQIKDRVKETTTTTGTGALTLSGAMTGFASFSSVCSVNDTCYYCVQAVDGSGMPTGAWEVGLGTYSATNTLTRTTVLASSNAGAAVSFAAGTKQVWIDLVASQVAGMVPGGSATQLQFNDGGAFGGDADLTWDKTNNILYVGTAGATGKVQGTTASTTTGIGAALVIQGGTGGATNGPGGDVTIKSGIGTGAQAQGNLYITGTDASAGGGRGGSITIKSGFSGNAFGFTTGGDITIQCGSGYFGAAGTITIGNDNGAGPVKLLGGVGISQPGGTATVQGGTGSSGGSGGTALVAGGDTINPGQAIVRGGDGGNQYGGGNATLRGGNSTQSTIGGSTAPGTATVKGGDAGGNTNAAAGGNVLIYGGQGGVTNGAGGNVLLYGGAGQGTGPRGNVVLNGTGAALATSATGGFTCLPSCAGTPTGTPANVPAGTVPFVYDSTNKALYAYSGGAWNNTDRVVPRLTILTRSAAQTIATNTWTQVSFDTTTQDDIGAFSSATPTKVTVPAGYTKMRITFYVAWGNNSLNERYTRIDKNGAVFKIAMCKAVNESAMTLLTRWVTVAPGDYFELLVNQSSGSTTNIAGTTDYGGPCDVQFEWAP